MKRLRHASHWLAFLLSAVLIYVVFRNVNWAEMRDSFHRANYLWVVLGGVVGMGGFVVRAWGWQFLLRPMGRFRPVRLFTPVAIGYLANNVFPARLGEFVRAYVVGRREGISKSAALATIIVERVFDGLTLLLILAVVSIFYRFPAWVKVGGGLAAAVFLGVAVFLAVVTVKIRAALRLVDLTLGRWAPVLGGAMKARLECFVAALDIRHHVANLAIAFLACIVRWGFESAIYVCIVHAMQLQVSPHGVLFVMVVVNIATMIPSAPGYVGTVQAACLAALPIFPGVDSTTAVTYSVLLHVDIFFPITITGIVCLIHSHLSLASLRREEESAAASPAASGN